MQQSSVIFANLIVAYLLFITMKGELPLYITLLRGGGQQAGGSGGDSGGSGGNAGTFGSSFVQSAASSFLSSF